MARNEEKHYGRLNRLYLLKEKEDYEKANPKRPRLDFLHTPEEIQKWLPSIKKEIDFYLKKSQVTCYSDAHVEESRIKVVKLEKEFKAFIRKMKQLSSTPLEDIPWTNRPYKKKKSFDSEENSCNEFKRIVTPILDVQEKSNYKTSPILEIDCSVMDQPLSFSPLYSNSNKTEKEIPPLPMITDNINFFDENLSSRTEISYKKKVDSCIENYNALKQSIVDYDSSDNENS